MWNHCFWYLVFRCDECNLMEPSVPINLIVMRKTCAEILYLTCGISRPHVWHCSRIVPDTLKHTNMNKHAYIFPQFLLPSRSMKMLCSRLTPPNSYVLWKAKKKRIDSFHWQRICFFLLLFFFSSCFFVFTSLKDTNLFSSTK